MDELILVDSEDNEIGCAEKESCHIIPTKLHRAFSIFILNYENEMLIHKRSGLKNTWPGFWTNACCSHPRKGESIEDAAKRRLMEELGFACPVDYIFKFQYKADYDERYGENEIDHVFMGIYGGPIKPDKDEIDEWRFLPIEALIRDVEKQPHLYTPWFINALPEVINHIRKTEEYDGS